MRNRYGKSLRIGLSRTGIALLQASGWIKRRNVLLTEAALSENEINSPDRLAARLNTLITDNRCTGLPVTVILADDLVRLFMATPPRNTTRLADCRIAAEMRFQSLYGEAASDWNIQAEWKAGQPFLACALPGMLSKVLLDVGRAHRLTLLEVAPQFIAAWNRWHTVIDSSAWFGVAHESLLTLAAMGENGLAMIRTTSVSPGGWSNPQWLPAHLEREALRLNLPVPQKIQLCGRIPADWETQNFGTLACMRLDTAAYATNVSAVSSTVALAHCGVYR